MMRIIGLLEAKRVLFLLAALLAAALVASTMGLSDADAKKKKKKKVPVTITCVVDKPCNGNAKNNTMNGTDSDDLIRGVTGNDTYNAKNDSVDINTFFNALFEGGDIEGDVMQDNKGNDTYTSYESTSNTGTDFIADVEGEDLVSLEDVSLQEAFDFGEIFAWDLADGNGFNLDGDGKDDLVVMLWSYDLGTYSGVVVISDAFGSGATNLEFSDGTISEDDLTASSAASALEASGPPESLPR